MGKTKNLKTHHYQKRPSIIFMTASTAVPHPLLQRTRLYLDLVRWDRPAGWLVVFWPTMVALWVAADGFPGWHIVLVFALGTILMRSAGCAINDVADRRFDLHVKRTAARPITTGAIKVRAAVILAIALALIALALVFSLQNINTVIWCIPAVVFTVIYPYTKRFFAMPQAFLGVAFNFGILIAYATILGAPDFQAWLLWLANMCMVLAYDTEYAMVDRDDDLKIGIRTSAITLGKYDVAGVMMFYIASLALTLYALRDEGFSWIFYAGILGAIIQVIWHYHLIKTRERLPCFTAFKNSHWMGASIFAGVAFDYAIRHF